MGTGGQHRQTNKVSPTGHGLAGGFGYVIAQTLREGKENIHRINDLILDFSGDWD